MKRNGIKRVALALLAAMLPMWQLHADSETQSVQVKGGSNESVEFLKYVNVYYLAANAMGEWVIKSANTTPSNYWLTNVRTKRALASGESSETVGTAELFSVKMSGEIYIPGPGPGPMPRFDVTGVHKGQISMTRDRALVPIGETATFVLMINEQPAPQAYWKCLLLSGAGAESNWTKSGSAESFPNAFTIPDKVTPGIYKVDAKPDSVGLNPQSGTFTYVGVKSVSAEGVSSSKSTPGEAETVYLAKGGGAVTVTASPAPTDVTSAEFAKLLAWEKATANKDGTATFNPSAAGETIVSVKCGNDTKAIKFIVYNLDNIKLKSVDYKGDGNYTLKKQGTDSYDNDKYEDNGNVIINYAEWQDTDLDGTANVNDPVCYKVSSVPTMDGVLDLGTEVSSKAVIKAKLKVKQSHVTLCEKDIILNNKSLSVSGLKWDSNYGINDTIENVYRELNWQISIDNGANYKTIGTPETQFLGVYDSPTGEVTAKRLNWCTNLASGKATPEEIANVIGPDAVGGKRFGGANSIFGSNPLSSAWVILDGIKADCGSLSTLMKYELDILGVTGSKVYFVYPRHAVWTGLAQESPPSITHYEKDKNGNQLGMWFVGGVGAGWNNYEGCCAFKGKWWEGGNGYSKDSAYNVLLDVTSPNLDGNDHAHQCWANNTSVAVSYPTGQP